LEIFASAKEMEPDDIKRSYPSLLTKSSLSKQHWLTLLTWMTVLALFVVAIWMRLHLLDVPFDRDSYDEGVYWQSLRSMSAGLHSISKFSTPSLRFSFSLFILSTLFSAKLSGLPDWVLPSSHYLAF